MVLYQQTYVMKYIIFPIFTFWLVACGWAQTNTSDSTGISEEPGNTIKTRFKLPAGFERVEVKPGSFEAYLRDLPLKPVGSKVLYFDGREKNNDVYVAVVDLGIGDKDLHQCADAVMRLKAEYLWRKGMYDKIHFNFTNGMRVDYSEWMKGRRIVIKGNKTHWNNRHHPSNTYEDFWNYMEMIFMYAGTSSLSKELKPIKMKQMKIGDVFIKGGFPGHAVIVLDMAINKTTGDKVFLLGQSYMPAQEFQVLKNNFDRDISPWYHLKNKTIYTPEWTFKPSNLKRW